MGAIDGVGSTPQQPDLVAENLTGPIQRAVQSPFGPKGDNYASMLVLTESNGDQSNLVGRAKPDGRDHGVGFGIGVGENNGKRQYFVGVRYLDGATPTDRLAVSAERSSSDAPIMNRSVPTLTTTAAIPVGGPLKGQILGDDSASLSAVGTRFDNPSVHVVMSGVSTNVSAGAGGVTLASRADTWQGVKNWGASNAVDAAKGIFTKWSNGDLTMPIEGQRRPLPGLEGSPAIYSNAYTVGYTHPEGKPDPTYPFGGRLTVTATFPVDESRVPTAYKSIIDRLDRAQNMSDPAKREAAVTQIESDLHNSPQLEKGLIAWEQQQVTQQSPHYEQGTPAQPEQQSNPLGDLVNGIGRAAGPAAEGLGGALRGLWEFLNGGPGHAF
jgi:hypothetical protein